MNKNPKPRKETVQLTDLIEDGLQPSFRKWREEHRCKYCKGEQPEGLYNDIGTMCFPGAFGFYMKCYARDNFYVFDELVEPPMTRYDSEEIRRTSVKRLFVRKVCLRGINQQGILIAAKFWSLTWNETATEDIESENIAHPKVELYSFNDNLDETKQEIKEYFIRMCDGFRLH